MRERKTERERGGQEINREGRGKMEKESERERQWRENDKSLRQILSCYRVQIEDQSHTFSYQLSVKMQTDRQKNGKKRVKYKKEEKLND